MGVDAAESQEETVRRSCAAKAVAMVGAAAIYRKTRAPVRQNSPFHRAREFNPLRSLREPEDLTAGAGSLLSDASGNLALCGATASGRVSVASDEAKPRPLVYVALRDFTVQDFRAVSITEGYAPRVAAGLEVTLGRRVTLLNISLSGGIVESVLTSQLSQLVGPRMGVVRVTPDLVTLDVGGNSVPSSRLSVEDFADLMDRVCRKLPGSTVVVNILTLKPLASIKRAARFSAAINAAAKKHGCGLVDLLGIPEVMSTHEYIITYHVANMLCPSSA